MEHAFTLFIPLLKPQRNWILSFINIPNNYITKIIFLFVNVDSFEQNTFRIAAKEKRALNSISEPVI